MAFRGRGQSGMEVSVNVGERLRHWLCNMLAKKLSVEEFSVVYQGDLERSSMVI